MVLRKKAAKTLNTPLTKYKNGEMEKWKR